MELRRLGTSELHVSRLSLGSWRTFERIPRDTGVDLMRAARAHGLNFLDDARYNDETGAAPMRTGYSEVLFGELFRAAAWERAETVVANKLWWEFWPEQSAAAELDASLARMQFEYVDLIYAHPPPTGMTIAELVAAMGDLVSAGKARAWGTINWGPKSLTEAARAAEQQGVPRPCAAQLKYSLAYRQWVESPAVGPALQASGAGVVASFALCGGVLTGKYDDGGSGRAAAVIDAPWVAGPRARGRRLRVLAAELGASPAALAIAFALAHPAITSVLFGATSPEQLAENVRALEIDAATVRRVAAL
jgi:aryl-alcohol dehydrogenase-like predicted oxidoreductase